MIKSVIKISLSISICCFLASFPSFAMNDESEVYNFKGIKRNKPHSQLEGQAQKTTINTDEQKRAENKKKELSPLPLPATRNNQSVQQGSTAQKTAASVVSQAKARNRKKKSGASSLFVVKSAQPESTLQKKTITTTRQQQSESKKKESKTLPLPVEKQVRNKQNTRTDNITQKTITNVTGQKKVRKKKESESHAYNMENGVEESLQNLRVVTQQKCSYFNGEPDSCRYGSNCKFSHIDATSESITGRSGRETHKETSQEHKVRKQRIAQQKETREEERREYAKICLGISDAWEKNSYGAYVIPLDQLNMEIKKKEVLQKEHLKEYAKTLGIMVHSWMTIKDLNKEIMEAENKERRERKERERFLDQREYSLGNDTGNVMNYGYELGSGRDYFDNSGFHQYMGTDVNGNVSYVTPAGSPVGSFCPSGWD